MDHIFDEKTNNLFSRHVVASQLLTLFLVVARDAVWVQRKELRDSFGMYLLRQKCSIYLLRQQRSL